MQSELPWPPDGFPDPKDYKVVHDPLLNKADVSFKGKELIKRVNGEPLKPTDPPIVILDPRLGSRRKTLNRARQDFHTVEWEVSTLFSNVIFV